jgi:signal transduction histidine kinase
MKETKENIWSSEETTRLILNSALDGIVCIDTNGCIIVWNSQAEKIFGFAENEVIGRRLSEIIIPEPYRALHEAGLKRYLSAGHTLPMPLTECAGWCRTCSIGTGIGLAHCKKITELHSGKIWLNADAGKGSTFYFTIKKRNTDKWK